LTKICVTLKGSQPLKVVKDDVQGQVVKMIADKITTGMEEKNGKDGITAICRRRDERPMSSSQLSLAGSLE
jgi:hypothetical protein